MTLLRAAAQFSMLLAVTASLCAGSAHAQLVRDEISPDGVPFNQDYFSADDRYPETKNMLFLVDKYHMGEIVIRNLVPGRYEFALVDLKYTLHKFPNHPRALMHVSELAKHLDRITLPIQYFEHAIDLYPHYAITHYQYGQYLLAIGQVEQAISRLEEAVQRDPDLAVAHAELSKACAVAGDTERARDSAAEARRLGYQGATGDLGATSSLREP